MSQTHATETLVPDPNPEQTALLAAKVRRLMLIAGLTTGLGIAAVFIAIGYRLFHTEGSAQTELTATLPHGARVVATGVAGDRLIVTLDVGGATEIRTFDAHSLKPAGRMKFVNEP